MVTTTAIIVSIPLNRVSSFKYEPVFVNKPLGEIVSIPLNRVSSFKFTYEYLRGSFIDMCFNPLKSGQ